MNSTLFYTNSKLLSEIIILQVISFLALSFKLQDLILSSFGLPEVLLHRLCTHREDNLKQKNVTIIVSMFYIWTATLAGLSIMLTACVATLPKFARPRGR